MSTLSDKLKTLGVKVGAKDLPPSRPRYSNDIDHILGGNPIQTPFGETYSVETRYHADYQHGTRPLAQHPPLIELANWAGDHTINDIHPTGFAFLDIETTGLSGGTGTYAFLVGIARFIDQDTVLLSQFFLRDPSEEPAFLYALENFLSPCSALVTFNGKAFDIPSLTTRYTLQGWVSPFKSMFHIDLLHLARRLWRDRLPSRTLGNIEVQILGITRTVEDVPGWLIPDLYFEYLRSGDAEHLKSVFYHNAVDVISMIVLFNHTATMLSDPLSAFQTNSDLTALGKLFAQQGNTTKAVELFRQAIEVASTENVSTEALILLADIYKKQGDFPAAVELWKIAASRHHQEAHIELAKYYEHRQRDFSQALRWTQGAMEIAAGGRSLVSGQHHGLHEMQHRLNRIQRKLASQDKPVDE